MHFSFPPLRTVTNATNAVWDATNDRVSIAAGRPFQDKLNWHIFTGGAVGPGCRIIDSANSNIFSPLFPFLANIYSAVKRNTNLTSRDGCWRYGGARRSGWAAQCSVRAVQSAKIFPEIQNNEATESNEEPVEFDDEDVVSPSGKPRHWKLLGEWDTTRSQMLHY